MILEYFKQYPAALAIVAALALSLFILPTHTMVVKLSKSKKIILPMFFSFIIYGLLWLLVGTYINIFIKSSLTFFIAGFSTIGFICLGYMECFIMTCRGFSFRIIFDIYLRGSMTSQEIINNYAGKGIDWLIFDRIEKIKNLNLLKLDGEKLEIKSRLGFFIARSGLFMKKLLNIGEGG